MVSAPVACAFSVASSVSIVLINKHLISREGFKWVTTLTSWHMLVTYSFLEGVRRLGWFEEKVMPWKPLCQFALLNGLSIASLNLALGYNSVGFYQMAKLAVIPVTVLIHTTLYGKRYSLQVKLSLGLLLLGVGIATVTDVQLNLLGSLVAGVGVLSTSVSQIWTNTLQKNHSLSSTQLLHNSSPLMALALFLVGIPVDNALVGGTFLSYQYSTWSLSFVVLSCATAIAVNLASFLVIGKCDAVTYQVLGHVKTCLIISFGFVVMHQVPSVRNASGLAVAVLGMIAYTYFETRSGARDEHTKQEPPQEPKVAQAQADGNGLSTTQTGQA